MMAIVSWAKKELARFRVLHKPKSLMLLPSSSSSNSSVQCLSSTSPICEEVIVAADLRCADCQRRVASILARNDDLESLVVHVLEKKVTLSWKPTSK